MDERRTDAAKRSSGPPDWLSSPPDVCRVDVRPLLAEGENPLTLLVAAAEAVALGGILVVDAPFNPTPLRGLLAGLGFSSYGQQLAGAHWRIHFHRDGGAWGEADAEAAP